MLQSSRFMDYAISAGLRCNDSQEYLCHSVIASVRIVGDVPCESCLFNTEDPVALSGES